jgi:hypothetical protein
MPFIILPAGDLSNRDKMISFSKLSMRARLFFCCLHTNAPILVIGHPKMADAKFVKENDLGLVAKNLNSIKNCIKIFLTKIKDKKYAIALN